MRYLARLPLSHKRISREIGSDVYKELEIIILLCLFKYGYEIPLDDFIHDVFFTYGISLSQLHPNRWLIKFMKKNPLTHTHTYIVRVCRWILRDNMVLYFLYVCHRFFKGNFPGKIKFYKKVEERIDHSQIHIAYLLL